MKKLNVLLMLGMLVCIFGTSAVAQIRAQQIYAATSDIHPGVIFLTVDDLMDEASKIDGTYQTIGFKNVLRDAGLPGTFFNVACHIAGQGYPIAGTSQCVSLGDVPISVLQEISNDGFLVGNHTFSHVPFSLLSEDLVIQEAVNAQKVVDQLDQALGLKVIRCPGLDCGSNVTILNDRPGLSGLRGPINADVGGGFYTDNIQPVPGYPSGSSVGGDWWFYLNNLPPELAGYYYVRDVVNFGSKYGLIVIFHTRSDVMIGWDGSRQFPTKLIQYVLANLPSRFTFAPLDGIPGLLGNVQTTAPELISAEFGTSDGQGRVVAGSLTGNLAEVDLCKARDGSVRCMLWKQAPYRRTGLPDSSLISADTPPTLELAPSTPWLDINDPDWTSDYGSKFWLADVNNDGRVDLILPSKAGLMVGYSNGVNGFSSPELLLGGDFDSRGIRFADLNGDGYPDLIVWTLSAVLTYLNNGHGGYNVSTIASLDFTAANGWDSDLYLAGMQVTDFSYDGCPDLLMRGPTDVMVALGDCQGNFLPAQSWSKRFSDRQNFSLSSQNLTFSAAKINGYAGIAAGLFTGGIVFQQSDPQQSKLGQYRYVMDNHSYSGDPGFHQEVFASDVIFADIYNDGNTVPVQVRANGLYASHLKIVN